MPTVAPPPPGWYADPSGRHQSRFWDGETWSPYVADGGVEGLDPIEAKSDGAAPRAAAARHDLTAGIAPSVGPATAPPAPPPNLPPAGPPAMRGRARRRRSTGWWIALGAALTIVVVGGVALVNVTGVFEDRCGQVEPGADLSGCGLRGAKLQRENLSRADLSRADLRRADLRGALLKGADLSEARVAAANFGRADLSGATVERIHGLAKANLIDARVGDPVLASAFGIAPAGLASFLARHRVQLEPPAVVGRALRKVCDGGSVPGAARGANGTLGVVGGHGLAGSFYAAPRGWMPVARHHAARVACLSDQPTTVETCQYSFTGFGPGFGVARVQDVVSVVVRNARSGRQIGSTSFTGGYPRECPASISLGTNRIWGAGVPRRTITAWLAQWRGGGG